MSVQHHFRFMEKKKTTLLEENKAWASETKPNPTSTIPSKPRVRGTGEFPACVWHVVLSRQVICSEAEIIKKAELSLGRK